MHTHTHTHTHMYSCHAHIHMQNTHMHTYICKYTYAYIHMQIHIHTQIHIFTHIYANTHMEQPSNKVKTAVKEAHTGPPPLTEEELDLLASFMSETTDLERRLTVEKICKYNLNPFEVLQLKPETATEEEMNAGMHIHEYIHTKLV